MKEDAAAKQTQLTSDFSQQLQPIKIGQIAPYRHCRVIKLRPELRFRHSCLALLQLMHRARVTVPRPLESNLFYNWLERRLRPDDCVFYSRTVAAFCFHPECTIFTSPCSLQPSAPLVSGREHIVLGELKMLIFIYCYSMNVELQQKTNIKKKPSPSLLN